MLAPAVPDDWRSRRERAWDLSQDRTALVFGSAGNGP
jgi:hypothetical protein